MAESKTFKAKLVKGQSYNLQGFNFTEPDQEKALPERLKGYVKNHSHFEVVEEDLEESDDDDNGDSAPASKDDSSDNTEVNEFSKDDAETFDEEVNLNDLDQDELFEFAEANDIDVGNASKPSTLRKKIRKALNKEDE